VGPGSWETQIMEMTWAAASRNPIRTNFLWSGASSISLLTFPALQVGGYGPVRNVLQINSLASTASHLEILHPIKTSMQYLNPK